MATTSSKLKSVSPDKKAPGKKSSSNGSGIDNSMLKEFFIGELKDIYWAEKHLTKVLPKMAKASTSQQLKDAINEHLNVTQTHVTRLEDIFGMLGKKAQAKKCDAMAGITEEGDGIVEETEAGTSTRDVGVILAAQKAEHYEIATYGGLAQLAKTLGLNDVADVLSQTLEEEKQADQTLSSIAENDINYKAAEENESEPGDDDKKESDNEEDDKDDEE